MVEFKGIAEEYEFDYNAAISFGNKKVRDAHTYVVRQIAAERDWEYREDPAPGPDAPFHKQFMPYGYMTSANHSESWKLENGDYISLLLYSRNHPVPGLKYEAVLFHWKAGYVCCWVYVCPVYAPPEPPYGCYEHSGTTLSLRDGIIRCRVYETYADSDDIHDHDHFDTESGFTYNPKTHKLRYYIPEQPN